MKKLIIISLLFISSSFAYSDPYYDPNHKTVVYDTTYNDELFNYLDKEYDKKCHRQISETERENICGVNSYGDMVYQKYFNTNKTMEEELMSNDSKKSKAELLKEIKEDIAYHNELMEKYNNTCKPGYELYDKKVEELKQKGYFWFSVKEKLYQDMLKDGSICSPTAHIDMVDIPFHEWRMQKLKNK